MRECQKTQNWEEEWGCEWGTAGVGVGIGGYLETNSWWVGGTAFPFL